MQRRVKVRVNGRGDGGVLVLISADTTDEQFVEAAAKKVFKRDAAAAAAVNPAKARIYLPGGEFEADLETIEHDEEVVIAFNGSPYKQKLQRTEEERAEVQLSSAPALTLPASHQPDAFSTSGVRSVPAAASKPGVRKSADSNDDDVPYDSRFNFSAPRGCYGCHNCRCGYRSGSARV
jgi:hypothetical protein